MKFDRFAVASICSESLAANGNLTASEQVIKCVVREMNEMLDAYHWMRWLPTFACVLAFLKVLHEKLQAILVKSKAFSSIMIAFVSLIFTVAMLEYFVSSVWPLSGIDSVMGMSFPLWHPFEMKAACLVLDSMGPWRLWCMAYACVGFAFTPLLLLPPVQSTSLRQMASFHRFVRYNPLRVPGPRVGAALSCWKTFWLQALVIVSLVQLGSVHTYFFTFFPP